MKHTILVSVAVVLTSACGGAATRFDNAGFHHVEHPYSVSYASLGPDWMVDSHQLRGNGTPGRAKGSDIVALRVDSNDDGVAEPVGRTPVSDLRLRHRSHDAVVWTRSLVVPAQLETRPLPALGDAYLASAVTAGALGADLFPTDMNAPPAWNLRVVDTIQTSVDGHEAFGVLADIVPRVPTYASRPSRVALVFVRTRNTWTDTTRAYDRHWPVALVAGYMTDASSFDGGWDYFRAFLASIDIRDHEG